MDELDLSQTSAAEDFAKAFPDDDDDIAEEVLTPDEPSEDENPTDGEEPTDAPDAPADANSEDISRVLQHPELQARIREAFARGNAESLRLARLQWEAEQRRAREEEDLALLDDEEYGKRLREQQQTQPIIQRAQAQGYARAQQEFFQNAVGSVWQTVSELKTLPEDKRRALDPTNPEFRTYGDYISRLVDTVSNLRAEARAKEMADKIVEARLADERTKSRRENPGPRGVPGPASGPGPIVDLDKMSGEELLRSYFNSK